MKKLLLPYSETDISKVVLDYFAANENLKPFYRYSPSIDSFHEAIEDRKNVAVNRKALFDALSKQHEAFLHETYFAKSAFNILSLKNKNTFTVTTAHQPNLFLGPLYLIYKIISAINLSKQLKERYSDYHFVPVYWMGTEDHDKEELNHIHLFGKKMEWQTDQTGAVGRMKTDSLQPILSEIKKVLGDSEEAKKCMELMEDCYGNEKTIVAATRKLLYHFFADDGLVILDADDALLKREFIPLMKKDLFEHFPQECLDQTDKLFSKHYDPQISHRHINLFYLNEDKRERIEQLYDVWKVRNTNLSFNQIDLEKLLSEHPERFSPNVVLRPLYQALVLPDVAFLGGAAEVAYYLQLRPLFDVQNFQHPVVFLRNSVLWLDENQSERMKKLGIEAKNIFRSVDELIAEYMKRQSGDDTSFDKQKNQLALVYDEAIKKATAADASLKASFEAEKVKALKMLDAMEDRLMRAAKKKEETSVQQIKTLKEKLFPDNNWQERYDNWMQYYVKYGDSFFTSLKENLDPMEMKFTILEN